MVSSYVKVDMTSTDFDGTKLHLVFAVAVILDGAISHRKLNCLITIYLNLTVFYSQSSKHFCDSIFPMYSGGKH